MWVWDIFSKKNREMSVRIRITILFASMVLMILVLVCISIYYFSYTNRVNSFRTRLTNWAISTGRLLSQSSVFDQQMILKIDASTMLAMKDKNVQAYDQADNRIYNYNDRAADAIQLPKDILNRTREEGDSYFSFGRRDVISHYFNDKNFRVVMVAAAFDEDGKQKLVRLSYVLLFSFLGGILIAIAAGYLFSKRLLVPLRKIADEIKEISVQNLAGRIKAGEDKDEWNYLADTINQLLYRLQDGLEIHRRFISNASHELSTPLTSISSQLEISLNRDREASEYRVIMESIYQDVRQLSRLTQTLLEFARASGDPGGLEIDLVRIDEVLLFLPGEISKLNETHQVKLIFEKLPDEEDKLLVFGNEELLITAIRNIAVNACKYSDDHVATIKLASRDSSVIINIEDRGKGIPEIELRNIFQPFYRVSNNRNIKGFGLGLSLANQIIKLHKGQIDVHSVPEKGTEFIITLPVAGSLSKNPAAPD
jgi:two-component system sensor histidine kinase ArlS